MLKIIGELKMIHAQQAMSQKDQKDGNLRSTYVSFEDLCRTMEEFDVVLRRPAYLEEKVPSQPHLGNS